MGLGRNLLGGILQGTSQALDVAAKAGYRYEDSMVSPIAAIRGVHKGDLLLFDPEVQPADGDTVMICKPNEKPIIRLYVINDDGSVTLTPRNTAIHHDESFDTNIHTIIGVMLEAMFQRVANREPVKNILK